MPDRPAQYEHDGLLAVAPQRRRGQTQHIARMNGLERRLEGIRRDVVTSTEAQLSDRPEFYDRQKESQDKTCIMEKYTPGCAPAPGSWLELDEQERISLVETYHRVARIKLPNVAAHAAFHVIVENQIALNLEPVVRAMHRLRNQGLSRHGAIHAISSVAAEHLFDILKTERNENPEASQASYYAAVERLTAAHWHKGEP
ncbi:hypothetical protein [Paraburkholderia sp. BL6665CI2N2]|uniref:hypothetical protein n=1 Tax=Paraburkholderia sp. BL6665CI2N2 TaxID=1938806 RepID=UPI001FB96F39|nr:hypothetical protein [Paraburkholderia sp. BL6665CI2N2]